IPQEVKARFEESNWVGSSLILSDEDLNKETGPATDFIVVSSTDPQGGLIMRKPEPAALGRPGREETNRSYNRPEADFHSRRPSEYSPGALRAMKTCHGTTNRFPPW